MRGLIQNLKSNKSSPLALFMVTAFFTSNTHGFVPSPGLVARFQPGLLKNQKPFIVKGTLTFDNKKIPSTLTWYGPQKYQLQISPIPKSAYSIESGASTWTLSRDGKACSLKADSQLVGCPAPMLWANLELSASGDQAVRALRHARIFKDSDGAYQESDLRRELEKGEGERRSTFNVGANGNTPVAVIEIQGEEYQMDSQGLAYPVVHFDPSFLAPLLARAFIDGEILTWKSAADVEISKEHPRYSAILSSRLEVFSGKELLGVFSRQPLQSATKLSEFSLQRPIGDVSALKSSLSGEGQNLLKLLLLTH